MVKRNITHTNTHIHPLKTGAWGSKYNETKMHVNNNQMKMDDVWWCSARNSKNTEKSSVMWLNTIVGRAGNGAASKALSSVRYSSIGLHERTASGQIILPLDVEETVTCFCRFDFYCILIIYFHHHRQTFHGFPILSSIFFPSFIYIAFVWFALILNWLNLIEKKKFRMKFHRIRSILYTIVRMTLLLNSFFFTIHVI